MNPTELSTDLERDRTPPSDGVGDSMAESSLEKEQQRRGAACKRSVKKEEDDPMISVSPIDLALPTVPATLMISGKAEKDLTVKQKTAPPVSTTDLKKMLQTMSSVTQRLSALENKMQPRSLLQRPRQSRSPSVVRDSSLTESSGNDENQQRTKRPPSNDRDDLVKLTHSRHSSREQSSSPERSRRTGREYTERSMESHKSRQSRRDSADRRLDHRRRGTASPDYRAHRHSESHGRHSGLHGSRERHRHGSTERQWGVPRSRGHHAADSHNDGGSRYTDDYGSRRAVDHHDTDFMEHKNSRWDRGDRHQRGSTERRRGHRRERSPPPEHRLSRRDHRDIRDSPRRRDGRCRDHRDTRNSPCRNVHRRREHRSPPSGRYDRHSPPSYHRHSLSRSPHSDTHHHSREHQHPSHRSPMITPLKLTRGHPSAPWTARPSQPRPSNSGHRQPGRPC